VYANVSYDRILTLLKWLKVWDPVGEMNSCSEGFSEGLSFVSSAVVVSFIADFYFLCF
jgi:hypothetical protein